MDGLIYVAIGRNQTNCASVNYGSSIFIWDQNNNFHLIQRIPLIHVSDIVHFENNEKHYLAISDSSQESVTQSAQNIYIYRNQFNKRNCSFYLFQKLEFENTLQLEAFTFGKSNSPQQFLAAVSNSLVKIWQLQGIIILCF